MKITVSERLLQIYQADRLRLQYVREADSRRIEDHKKFDKMVTDRIQRNIRLGLDKGRNVDMDC
jgi:hypothetical protein